MFTKLTGQFLTMAKYCLRGLAVRSLTDGNCIDLSTKKGATDFVKKQRTLKSVNQQEHEAKLRECTSEDYAKTSEGGQQLLKDITEGEHDGPLFRMVGVIGNPTVKLTSTNIEAFLKQALQPLQCTLARCAIFCFH